MARLSLRRMGISTVGHPWYPIASRKLLEWAKAQDVKLKGGPCSPPVAGQEQACAARAEVLGVSNPGAKRPCRICVCIIGGYHAPC